MFWVKRATMMKMQIPDQRLKTLAGKFCGVALWQMSNATRNTWDRLETDLRKTFLLWVPENVMEKEDVGNHKMKGCKFSWWRRSVPAYRQECGVAGQNPISADDQSARNYCKQATFVCEWKHNMHPWVWTARFSFENRRKAASEINAGVQKSWRRMKQKLNLKYSGYRAQS